MSRQSRFEVVRGDAGWFARFIARGVDKRYRVRQRDNLVLEVRLLDQRARTTEGAGEART